MENEKTIGEFIEYQNHFKDIIAILKEGYLHGMYKEWKGFIPVNGPVLFNPDILFIGINPGQGLFIEANWESTDNKKIVPFRILTGDDNCYSKEYFFPNKIKYRTDEKTIELDWFIDGNFKKNHWWDLNVKEHNNFVRYMINILCKVAEMRTGEKFQKGKCPDWYNDFGKKIMFMNISPFATTDLSELNKLNKDLQIDEWNDYIKPLRILVRDNIKPKVIVFAGNTASKKFMRGDGEQLFGIPKITIERKRGWHADKNLSIIACQISAYLKSYEKYKQGG